MDIFKEKEKFERFIIAEKIQPLTVAYHGSLFLAPHGKSDLDVVLIVPAITPVLLKKIAKIKKLLAVHLGVSVVATREAGTIFGGLKYLDALCRHSGSEHRFPYAYYKIATLNELFRRFAIDGNLKKCTNIATIITKTINNHTKRGLGLNVRTIDLLVISLDKNLGTFYKHENIKPGVYSEDVKVKK